MFKKATKEKPDSPVHKGEGKREKEKERKGKVRQKARRNIKTLISQKNPNGNDTSRIIAHKR